MIFNTRTKRLSHSLLAVLFSLATVLNGCATRKPPEHETPPVTYYPYSQEKDGLVVAVQPVMNAQESKKYFDADLLSAGILAVFVTVENRSSPSSFLIAKERFSLRAGGIEASGGPRRDQLSSEIPGEVVALAGAALISFPILFFGTKLISDASVVQHNFAVKELQPKTISAGEATRGFVYFQFPKGSTIAGQWTLHLEAQDLTTKQIKSFALAF